MQESGGGGTKTDVQIGKTLLKIGFSRKIFIPYEQFAFIADYYQSFFREHPVKQGK